MKRHVLTEGTVCNVDGFPEGSDVCLAIYPAGAKRSDEGHRVVVPNEMARGAFGQPARVVVEVGESGSDDSECIGGLLNTIRDKAQTIDDLRGEVARRAEETISLRSAPDRYNMLLDVLRTNVTGIPVDLSAFPSEDRATIAQALQEAADANVDTTRWARRSDVTDLERELADTNADLVRLLKDRDAVSARYGALLDVLSTNVAGLPVDLSPFPATDRAQIAEGLREVSPDPATWVRLDDVIALCAGQVARANRELAKGDALLEDAARLRGERGMARWVAVYACPPTSGRSHDAQIATGVFSGGADVLGVGPVQGADEGDRHPMLSGVAESVRAVVAVDPTKYVLRSEVSGTILSAVEARDGAMEELRVLRAAVLAVTVPQDFDNISVRRLCGDAVANAMAHIAIGMSPRDDAATWAKETASLSEERNGLRRALHLLDTALRGTDAAGLWDANDVPDVSEVPDTEARGIVAMARALARRKTSEARIIADDVALLGQRLHDAHRHRDYVDVPDIIADLDAIAANRKAPNGAAKYVLRSEVAAALKGAVDKCDNAATYHDITNRQKADAYSDCARDIRVIIAKILNPSESA